MKISTVVKMVGMALAVIMLTGCGWVIGEKVEVPPAHVGKIMGKDGYREGTIPTSMFRLDGCTVWCDKLIVMNVADFTMPERMEVFMPEDKLVMTFELGITLTPDPAQYDSLFGRVSPEGNTIPVTGIYVTYAQRVIQSVAREVVTKYTIAEISSSREQIAVELTETLSNAINSQTPFSLRYLGITDIDYPAVITDAQVAAAKRREEIQQEEAQLEISKVTLERQLQETRLQRAIDIERAQAEAEVNRILGESMTPNYVRYRELGALDSLATSESTVWVPSHLLDTVAGQVAVGNGR